MTLIDSIRPVDQQKYYPGEINLRMADLVLVTKTNNTGHDLKRADECAAHLKPILPPGTPILYGGSNIKPEAKDSKTGRFLSEEQAAAMVRNKRVLVVDDGPTLTHGGLPFGAGYVMAQELGAAVIVDPRPYAKGSLVGVFEKFKHMGNVLPAMGYGEHQINDLKETIDAIPCDTIVLGTPSDMAHVIPLHTPAVVARYELEVLPKHAAEFDAALDSLVERFETHHPKAA
jgi:predicted GTPase